MAGQCELLLEGLRWMWSKEKGCNVMAGLFADLPLTKYDIPSKSNRYDNLQPTILTFS